ncbi:MAG: hypothetical protein AMS24_04315 [Chlamydiae bacterium SM23_39]|nr:MAG: hypothetical protein AMS24_04315 [Chlamydiae bacterium SM23_39]
MNKINPSKKSEKLEDQQIPNLDSEKLFCSINHIKKSPHCNANGIPSNSVLDEIEILKDSKKTRLEDVLYTPREILLNNIKDIFKKEFPNICLSDFDISMIIYNNQKFIKDDFLHARKVNGNLRPDLLVLMKIIYNIQSLTIDDEKLKKMVITSQILNRIKRDVRNTVIDFIFSNPYDIKYIKEDNRVKFQKDTNFWRPEFELFLDLWYSASLNYRGPITIRTFQKRIGNPAFSTPTKIGICNTKYFYKLFKKLPHIFPKISQDDLKLLHDNLKKYIKIRNLSEVYHDYSIYWDDEVTKKAQITILLLRDSGVEILTLETIPSISFNKYLDLHDSSKYQRHHIFTNDKDSIDPNRLVLSVLNTHTSLEGLTNIIIDLITERIKWNDFCPHFYLNNINNAQLLWKEFLKRRNDITDYGIEYFFRTYYPDVVNRFYNNVPNDLLEFEIKQVIQDWIKDGNPKPILPKYLENLLI